MQTTQSAFSSMRGHVIDGQQVTAENGDILTIKNTIHGWDIYLKNAEIARCGHNAYAVEKFIVNYPR